MKVCQERCYFQTPDARCDQVTVVKEHEGSISLEAWRVWKWANATRQQIMEAIRKRLWLADDLENFASAVVETLAELGVICEVTEAIKNRVRGREYVLQRMNGEALVYVREADGSTRGLRHVVRHSPDGFEWGYGGSGPADLALSILCDLIPEEEAETLYQNLKWDMIATLPRAGAVIAAVDVLEWVQERRKHRMRRLEKSETQQVNLEGGEPVA